MTPSKRFDRRILLAAVSATIALAGCGQGGDSQARPRYDYVTAVRPLAYDNAFAACSGHSLTSLALEFEITGPTFTAAAHAWARGNQLDVRLREVSFRGCRDGLRETAERPVQIERPALTESEITVYIAQYATCLGLTIADVARLYGLDVEGMTVAGAVRALIRRSYAPAYRQVAYDACLAAIRGEPPRYGS